MMGESDDNDSMYCGIITMLVVVFFILTWLGLSVKFLSDKVDELEVKIQQLEAK